MSLSTNNRCISIGRQDNAYWNCCRKFGFMSSIVSWLLFVVTDDDVADVVVAVLLPPNVVGASARAFIPACRMSLLLLAS